jgi:choline dehydrogenase
MAHPLNPIAIEANFLWHPDDLKAPIAGVHLCREIGNSAALRPVTKREVMPRHLEGAELERFVRDGAESWWHQPCTAKMGRDPSQGWTAS